MKKLSLLLTLMCLKAQAAYTLSDFFAAAATENNKDLMVQIASQMTDEELNAKKVTGPGARVFGNKESFLAAVQAKKSTGGGMTEAQAQALLAQAGAKAANVKNTKDAANALNEFFSGDEVGAKLLKQLDKNGASTKAIQQELGNIAKAA